jgi:hypothetical protein
MDSINNSLIISMIKNSNHRALPAQEPPMERTLDLDAVQAFVLAADLQSFTRAAEALDSTQSAISLKLKKLEQRLGRRLLERTPRLVRLSAEGQQFLPAARAAGCA